MIRTLAPNTTWYKGSTSKSAITEINIVSRYKLPKADTLEWDGNTEGLTRLDEILGNVPGIMFTESLYYKVSDAVPTKDDITNGYSYTNSNGTTTERTASDIAEIEGALLLGSTTPYTAQIAVTNEGTFLKSTPGSGGALYIASFTIPGYTGFSPVVESWDASAEGDGRVMCYVERTKLIIAGGEGDSVDCNQDSTGAFADFTNVETMTGCSVLNTGSVWSMSRMFKNDAALTELKGLTRWNTMGVRGFDEMFYGCANLKKLDLSSFETFYAANGTDASGVTYNAMRDMFYGMDRLEEITLGANFAWNGDGVAGNEGYLPPPNPDYITGADGSWYTLDAESLAPASIPNNTAATYYASLAIAENVDVTLKNGTLIGVANAIRTKTESQYKVKPSEMAEKVLSIDGGGVELPVLTNPAFEDEIFMGKEVIDETGAARTGTFTITDELVEQDTLIKSLEAALVGKGAAIPVEEKDVNFWDYDGTLLYSYTVEEAQALTELPPLPDWHDGLIAQKWMWTLDEIKAANSFLDTTPYYTTADGATHLIIENNTDEDIEIPIVWYQLASGAVTIDYGDGSEPETPIKSGAAIITANHVYAPGTYTVKLIGNSSFGLGDGTTTNSVVGGDATIKAFLRRAHLGANAYPTSYAFDRCTGLECVTVPQEMTTERAAVFRACTGLRLVPVFSKEATFANMCYGARVLCFKPAAVLANQYAFSGAVHRQAYVSEGTTALGDQAFYGCRTMRRIHLPSTLTKLVSSCFVNCYALQELAIPSGVTSIGANMFTSCTALRKIKFTSKTPPAASASTTFSGVPSNCVVEVPAASLAAYQAATNYSGIAAQMVGV